MRYFGVQGYIQRCAVDDVEVPEKTLTLVDRDRAGGWAHQPGFSEGFDNIQAMDEYTVRRIAFKVRHQNLQTAFQAKLPLSANSQMPIRSPSGVKQSRPHERKTSASKPFKPPVKIGRPKKDPNAPTAPYRRKVDTKGHLVNPHPGMRTDVAWDTVAPPKNPRRPVRFFSFLLMVDLTLSTEATVRSAEHNSRCYSPQVCSKPYFIVFC